MRLQEPTAQMIGKILRAAAASHMSGKVGLDVLLRDDLDADGRILDGPLIGLVPGHIATVRDELNQALACGEELESLCSTKSLNGGKITSLTTAKV